MSHFQREAKLQWLIPASILIIALLATVFGSLCHPGLQALRVDACLDSGGSFDYESGQCDHERSHRSPAEAL